MDYRNYQDLHNWEKNETARDITDVNWNKLITDIRRRGIIDPLKIDDTGTVYDGNHRLKAVVYWINQGITTAENGVDLTQVPIIIHNPSSEQEKWEIAFTRNEEFASWNEDGLSSYQTEWEGLELSLFNVEFDDPESIDEQLFAEEKTPRSQLDEPHEVICPNCQTKFAI